MVYTPEDCIFLNLPHDLSIARFLETISRTDHSVGGFLLRTLLSAPAPVSVSIPTTITPLSISQDSPPVSEYQQVASFANFMYEVTPLTPLVETESSAHFRSQHNLDLRIKLYALYLTEPAVFSFQRLPAIHKANSHSFRTPCLVVEIQSICF